MQMKYWRALGTQKVNIIMYIYVISLSIEGIILLNEIDDFILKVFKISYQEIPEEE